MAPSRPVNQQTTATTQIPNNYLLKITQHDRFYENRSVFLARLPKTRNLNPTSGDPLCPGLTLTLSPVSGRGDVLNTTYADKKDKLKTSGNSSYQSFLFKNFKQILFFIHVGIETPIPTMMNE